ncbi:MAG: hypothetical protein AAB731_02805 [Patescibacteria group bacterium]
MGKEDAKNHGIIAVSSQEAILYGCPYCGGIYGYSNLSGGGAQIWNCSDCKKTSINLADGVSRSTIGIGDYFPKLQPHPRHGQPIDREKLIAERKQGIESEASADLRRWLLLGHGQPVEIAKVGSHCSKSRTLPILASKGLGNAQVTWFGDNFNSYFLGVKLNRPLPAILLYPMSGIFGSYALSGHTNPKVAPPITNFQKAYHNCAPIEVFGGDCGCGLQAALAIRYLEEVSKLDAEAILDICLRKSEYGLVDRIDGNCIEFADLAKLLGLTYEKFAYYDFDATNAPTDTFERVNVDWFDSGLIGGSSSVHVRMKEGVLLPPMPLPAEIFVDPADTALGRYIPPELQPRTKKKSWDKELISKVPVGLLGHRDDLTPEELQMVLHGDAHIVYSRVNPGTRDFTFHVPNVLDCALTAFFFIKVLAPVMREKRQP